MRDGINVNTDRMERLLALLLIQGMGRSRMWPKIHQLSLAGFSNVEIANLLEISAAEIMETSIRLNGSRARVTISHRRR